MRRPVQRRFPSRDVRPLRVVPSPVGPEEEAIARRRAWLRLQIAGAKAQVARARKRVTSREAELRAFEQALAET